MPIRFKCPHCKKGLAVKETLAGKKAACPACKKAIRIPAPVTKPVDVEALAAAAFSDEPPPRPAAVAAPPKPVEPQFVEFTCPFCDAALKFAADQAGKRSPCPECKNIVKVPNLEVQKPKDWREAQKGPALAAANQPQKMEGAWGTATDKGKVSQTALEEADAIVEEEEEPEFARGWLRRGLCAALVLGVVVLAWWGLHRMRVRNQQKTAIEQALDILDPKKMEAAKLKPAWGAAISCGAGEFFTARKEPAKARTHFSKALGAFGVPEGKDSADNDLFLMRLASALIELGGSEADAIRQERLEWRDVIKELDGALEGIGSEEARDMAVCDLFFLLMRKKQPDIAATITKWSKCHRIGLAAGERKDPPKDKKAPVANPKNLDLATRIGQAEALARKDQLEEALKLATTGPPNQQVQACVTIAGALAFDPQGSPERAARFVKKAIDLMADRKAKVKSSPWSMLQLVRVVLLTDREKAKELAKELPPEHRAWAQLAILQTELAKTTTDVPIARAQEVEGDQSLPRALAWVAVSRHNSRLGHQSAMRGAAEEQEDRRVRSMIYAGLALGVQDQDR